MSYPATAVSEKIHRQHVPEFTKNMSSMSRFGRRRDETTQRIRTNRTNTTHMTTEASNEIHEAHIGRFIDRWTRTNSLKRIRNHPPLAPRSPSSPVTRAYLQRLRAAEMAAWELTGGDYVRSSFAESIWPMVRSQVRC